MRLLQPIDALRDALIDPARRERNVVLALAFYTVVWTIYGTIAKSGQGLHPDMTELLDWSRDLAWGYKHPPFAAALVWLWFKFFPVAEWSYYLLAMLMPAIALWIVWWLSADYLEVEKRVFGIALLTLVPFFNFHALKFNVNTVLMPLWAATTLWFLRSYTTRNALYAALAGIAAAAAMMGKYWSIFLVAGLAVAALIDSRRAVYFRSAAPWITVAAGLIVLAPHLVWLVRHDFAPFSYAVGIHGDKPFAETVAAALGYLAGSAGYVAVPVIIALVAGRPGRAALADMIWPAEAERRLAAAAFWGPLLLPVVGALASGTDITSLWSMSAWTLLPVLLLSPKAMTVSSLDLRRLLAFAVALPLVMLIASPVIAVTTQRDGLAPAAARAWHDVMLRP
jgi:4-amino-4-deoxy-L-arabinose transferase-like glycosyltransferase